jgi:hypothetical protein
MVHPASALAGNVGCNASLLTPRPEAIEEKPGRMISFGMVIASVSLHLSTAGHATGIVPLFDSVVTGGVQRHKANAG